jgi:hypothetical protein
MAMPPRNSEPGSYSRNWVKVIGVAGSCSKPLLAWERLFYGCSED